MPEGEEKEEQTENLFEKIMKENFPNLVKELDMQPQDAHRVPKKLDPRRNTKTLLSKTVLSSLSHTSWEKYKERILKAERGKERVTYKGVPRRLSADFSKETLQARRG